jgi:hypothetical protein
MDSSFNNALEIMVAVFAVFAFLKLMIQFGLPRHPLRFLMFLVSLSLIFWICGDTLATCRLISMDQWIRWRSLPLVTTGVGLLIEAISIVGNFGHLQQKVISRIPLIASLVCFAIFPQKSFPFFVLSVCVGFCLLLVAKDKARYQFRLYGKMLICLVFATSLRSCNLVMTEIFSYVFFFVMLIYFFRLQQSFGISALIDEEFTQ